MTSPDISKRTIEESPAGRKANLLLEDSPELIYIWFGGLLIRSSTAEPDNLEQLREKLRSTLTSHKEVNEVSDLKPKSSLTWYSTTAIGSTFPPLVATIRVPTSDQPFASAIKDNSSAGIALAENFAFVTDGQLLYVGAECNSHEEFRGILLGSPDVREKIIGLIKEAVECETVGPTPAQIPFLVGHSNAPDWVKSTEAVFVRLEEMATVKGDMASVYDLTNDRLSTFYDIRYDADMTLKQARELGEDQTQLLDQLLILLNMRWLHPIQRRRVTNDIRRNIANILRLLSLHGSTSGRVSEDVADLDAKIARENILFDAPQNSSSNEALTKLGWKKHSEAAIVDRDSVLSIVEHVRSEVQVSRNLSVTIWAALIGAVIGSILTIIGTYFFSLTKLFAGL